MKLDQSLVQRAAPAGSMRYFAWLYTPEAHRDVIAALFLIEAELHDTARAPHEVAHIRLQWWREEIDRLTQGKAQHPATQILQAASRTDIGLECLHEVALSAAQELANSTYETDAELDQYLRNGLGGLFNLAAQYLTETGSATLLDAASQLGAFVRQVELTRDLRQDFHQGRLYLPLVTLDALNIDYEALQASDWPEAFVQLLKTRSTQQLAAYRTLKQNLLNAEKQILRPLLVLSELHAHLLQTLLATSAQHARQRLELTPLQKLWTAWRAARTAR